MLSLSKQRFTSVALAVVKMNRTIGGMMKKAM